MISQSAHDEDGSGAGSTTSRDTCYESELSSSSQFEVQVLEKGKLAVLNSHAESKNHSQSGEIAGCYDS